MLLGLSGQMSLGQAGFYAIGAYGSALLTAKLGWPIAAGMLAGISLAGVAGCLVGLVALRTRGLYLAMATLAFGFMVEIAAQRWIDLTGGTMGVYGIPSLDFGASAMGKIYFLWVVGAVYLAVQIVSDYVTSSRLRRNLLALKENESAARTAGINVPVWRTMVFAVSSLAAGTAGVVLHASERLHQQRCLHARPDADHADRDRHRRAGHVLRSADRHADHAADRGADRFALRRVASWSTA